MSNLIRNAYWLSDSTLKGYVPSPIPHELDDAFANLIGEWCRLPAEHRAAESLSITFEQLYAFLAFSDRMASKAVRHRDLSALHFGLIAAGIDQWRFDFRDNLSSISLHYRSCCLLGVDPVKVFSEAASFLTPKTRNAYKAFLSRTDPDRMPELMGYTASSDETGFRYKWIDK